MKKIFTTIAVLVFFSITVTAQDATIYLWRNIKGMEKQPSVMFMHKPSETVQNTRSAVEIPYGRKPLPPSSHASGYAESNSACSRKCR